MLGVVCVLLTLTLSGLALASAVIASHRARSAADLAALAGAGELLRGLRAADACSAAERVARGGGARLSGCSTVDGESLLVHVAVHPSVRGLGEAMAAARAGPAAPG